MDSLENFQDLLNSCLLPELKHDLDSIPIEKEHFKLYQEYLMLRLPLLYDWIQQLPNNWLISGEENERAKKQEIHACLIVLLCEINSTEAIYNLDRLELIRNAESILGNYGLLTKDVEELVLSYYEAKLIKGNWKKQLGAVHGFVKYLEFRFSDARDHKQSMSRWWTLIDAMSGDEKHQITVGEVFIGVFGTISFFMVNTVKNTHISEDNTSDSGARVAKIWLLIAFVIGFASIIAAVWVMIDDFINNPKKDSSLGVALLMQNVLILFASLTYKFGRDEEAWVE